MIAIGKGIGALGVVAVDVVAANHPGAVGHHCDMGTVLQHVAFCNAKRVAASGKNTDPVDTPLRAVDLKDIASSDATDVREPRPGAGIVIAVDVANEISCICTAPDAVIGGQFRSLVIAPGNAVSPAPIVDEVVHLGGNVIRVSGLRNRIGSETVNAGIVGPSAVLAETTHLIVGVGVQSVVELFASANFIPDGAGSEGTVLGNNVFCMSRPVTALGTDLSTTLRNRDPGGVLDREVKPAGGLTDIRNFLSCDIGIACSQRSGRHAENRHNDHRKCKNQFGEFLHSDHPFKY